MVDLEVGEEENRRGFGEIRREELRGREEKERREERAVALEGKREMEEAEERERESLEMEKEAAIVVERWVAEGWVSSGFGFGKEGSFRIQ